MIDHNREFPPDPNRPDPDKPVVIPPLRNLDAPMPKPGLATRLLTRQLSSLLGLWGLELPETIRDKIFIFPLTVCFIITELLAVNLSMVDPVSAILGSVLALGISWHGSLRVGMRWFSLVLVPTMLLACLFFSPWGAIWVTASSLGGAFGAMIRLSGVGEVIGELATDFNISYVLLAWLVTAIIRIAQGSATVAMITGVGLMSAIIGDGSGLDYHPLYVFLAIGFGSITLSWMNDSGFWVVQRLSGFTEKETLKTWSVLLTAIAVLGLVITLVGSAILPFK